MWLEVWPWGAGRKGWLLRDLESAHVYKRAGYLPAGVVFAPTTVCWHKVLSAMHSAVGSWLLQHCCCTTSRVVCFVVEGAKADSGLADRYCQCLRLVLPVCKARDAWARHSVKDSVCGS